MGFQSHCCVLTGTENDSNSQEDTLGKRVLAPVTGVIQHMGRVIANSTERIMSGQTGNQCITIHCFECLTLQSAYVLRMACCVLSAAYGDLLQIVILIGRRAAWLQQR